MSTNDEEDIEASGAPAQQPFLSEHGSTQHESATEDRIFPSFPQRRRTDGRVGLWTLLLLLALTTLATRLFNLPLNRVVELRYCRAYYRAHDPSLVPPGGDVPEELCKVRRVQQQLAWLQGVMETAVVGIDLAVTIPLGWVSDRYGRKVVLGLNAAGFIGMVMWTVVVGRLDPAMPVEAMVAGPFFTLIGGHDCVLTSTIFAKVTDLTEDLVQRTSYIAYISSVNYVISLFGPTLASATMSHSIWLPFFLSIGFLAAALPTIYALPTTGPAANAGDKSPSEEESNGPETSPLLLAGEGHEPDGRTNTTTPSPRKAKSPSERLHDQLRSLAHLVVGRRNFQILLLGFAVTALASSNTHLLPQYMSKRYGWRFERVGYLLSVKAAVNIALLALVIPTAMRLLLRRMPAAGSEVRLNHRGALLSLFVSVVGALAIAVAPRIGELMAALIVYALGSALPVFTMSLVESAPVAHAPASSPFASTTDSDSDGQRRRRLQPQQQHSSAQDYGVVMLTKTVGTLVGAPIMTVAWVTGIGLGGPGLGLPYYLSALLYACAVGVLCCLRL